VATWTKGCRKAAGQAFGPLKGSWPVNWFQAEAQALFQISEELVGAALLSQKHVEDLYACQVGETDDLSTVRQEPLDGFAFVVVQVEPKQQA
jgi:hypothetical protein